VREFFGSVKFKVFVVIACLLLGLMIRTAATGGISTATQNAIGVVISPLQSVSAHISDAVSGLIDNVINLSSLQSQNTKLKKQISQLESQMVDYDDVKRENEQLRGLVDITQESDNRKYATATVISRGPDQWFSSFTIDKGTLSGVQKNDPVITADGLVGIVVNSMLTTSVVSTILDPSVHAGCIVSQTGDTGITQGSSELSANGEFELAYLTKNSSVTTGNIIVTTGQGGIFPKDLKVGIVQNLQPDISGNSVNAVCKPMVDPSSVKDVFVITDFSGKQAADGVSSSSSASSGGK
jgi:rod shape-determining protein MreC